MITNRENAYHYKWGKGCEGWVMLARDDMLVIEERMPPGTSEHRHYHEKARQLFMVTEGEFTIEIEGAIHLLGPGDTIEVEPGQWHQAFNRSDSPVLFINTSSPSAHGDRVNEV
jgi:mannose-6-phosphate isomerase-like protein (cupin superfamily)